MTPADLHALAQHLRDHGPTLRRLSVADRCRSLTDAVARLADPDDPVGRRARDVLPETVGLSPAMVDWALRASTEPWLGGSTEPWLEPRDNGATVLENLLQQACPDPEVIAVPPVFTVLILAGNVFTAALRPLLLGLAVGTPILVKLPRDQDIETSLPALLRSALVSPDAPTQGTHRGVPLHAEPESDSLSGVGAGQCARPAAQPHPILGSTQSPTQGTHRGVPLHRALSITNAPATALETVAPDLVVAYGSDATMASLRGRLPPTIRLLEHGHGASAAWLPASALTSTTVDASARALALDIAAYDQRGCLSPVIAWIERKAEVSGTEFAARLHQALCDLATDLPPGPIDAATGAARAQWRGTAAVVGQLFESDDSSVVYVEDASLLPASPLHRHLAVVPCSGVHDLGRHLHPWGIHLKCLGVGGDAGEPSSELQRVASVLAPPLAPHLCPLGQMQVPPASWCAEGRRPLEGWLRWRNSR